MSLERLIDQTRERFPHYNQTQVEILPLDKGGSDRRYYRVRFSVDHSLILVKYNPEKYENERFVAIANFLDGIGINAPLIYYHDHDQGLIWMQDLGEEDLWHHRNETWAVRRRFYEAALDQVAVLHRTELALGETLRLQRGFDESLYRLGTKLLPGKLSRTVFSSASSRNKQAAGTRFIRESCQTAWLLIRESWSTAIFNRRTSSFGTKQAYLIDFQGHASRLAAI